MNTVSLYFIEWDGQYFLIPNISYGIQLTGSGEATTIEKVIFVQAQLVKKDIHLFDEKRFLDILSKDFSLPETASFIQSNHTYTLNFVRREAVLFSQNNLRKLDDLSLQIGKSVYIEKSGEKEWLSPKNLEISKIWQNDEDAQKRWDILTQDAKDTYNQERQQM